MSFVFRLQRDQLENIRLFYESTSGGDFWKPLHELLPLDVGPDPADITVTENELMSENTIEMNKLRTLLSQAKTELSEVKAELKQRKQFDEM